MVILLVRLSDPLFWKRHQPMALRTTAKLPCVDYAIFGPDEMTRILEGRRLIRCHILIGVDVVVRAWEFLVALPEGSFIAMFWLTILAALPRYY